jgi:GTP-binding protein HflX
MDVPSSVERDEYGRICRVFLSARSGAGLDGLRLALTEAKTARQVAAASEHGVAANENQTNRDE